MVVVLPSIGWALEELPCVNWFGTIPTARAKTWLLSAAFSWRRGRRGGQGDSTERRSNATLVQGLAQGRERPDSHRGLAPRRGQSGEGRRFAEAAFSCSRCATSLLAGASR